MRKALISTVEPISTGLRIAEISDTTFEVNPKLYWVDCNDDNVATSTHFYYPNTGQFLEIPPVGQPVTAVSYTQPTVQGLETL